MHDSRIACKEVGGAVEASLPRPQGKGYIPR